MQILHWPLPGKRHCVTILRTNSGALRDRRYSDENPLGKIADTWPTLFGVPKMKTIMQIALRLAARSLLALSLVFALSAFRHTDVETQTNPGYAGYTIDAVYVQIPTNNLYFKDCVLNRLTKVYRESKVRVYTSDDLYSPFRDWTPHERKETHGRPWHKNYSCHLAGIHQLASQQRCGLLRR